jgi:phosphate transport system substrate-binding protein
MNNWRKQVAMLTSAALLFAPLSALAEAVKVDDALPTYKKVDGISGTLNSVGSDTMNNLLKYWGEAFRKYYPGVNIQVEGKGSSTAPPALIAGTAQLGPMSRAMKSSEIDQFEAKYGFKPTTLSAALDALAVFVNKDNPVVGLSFDRLDAIFSKTRKRGYADDVTTWGQAGLTGAWADMPISLYGRNSASGTYGFFKDEVLDKGDFKDQVKEQPGSASVVQGVTEDKNAIGYSGIGYVTSGVKALSISQKEGGEMFAPTFENVVGKHYPLARFLYINIVKDPKEPLSPLVREFLRFVLSKEGQEIVAKDGYLPVPARVAAEELRKLGVEG